jgi:hypothetical protein
MSNLNSNHKILDPLTSLPHLRPSSYPKRNCFWLVGGFLLIFTLLFMGCSPAQVADQPPAPAAISPEIASTPTALPLSAPAPAASDVSDEATATTGISAGDSIPQPKFAAQIGKITFATEATDLYEPINASLLFTKGITQIHAIFDYSGMSPAYTWERVWLLNDKEVARKADVWTGPESGLFDYYIDNSGRPLPAGDWVLEIYVEGKLLSLGAFVIENSEEAQANSQ